MKIDRISTSYLRWRQQLSALHEGKLRKVKKIANEARKELEEKTQYRQLNVFAY